MGGLGVGGGAGAGIVGRLAPKEILTFTASIGQRVPHGGSAAESRWLHGAGMPSGIGGVASRKRLRSHVAGPRIGRFGGICGPP